MTTRRLGVAVAVLGGYLYAIGGSDGQSPLNTVERYDPRQNKWSQVSPMSTRRKHLGCAVFNNLIYAVGGRDDCMELSSAERYNPHTNSWSPIVAMTSRRSGVSILLHFGNLQITICCVEHYKLSEKYKYAPNPGTTLWGFPKPHNLVYTRDIYIYSTK